VEAASTVSVRLFELAALAMWLGGIVWVRAQRHPVYTGVYVGSTGLIVFDWIFNSDWFFRVQFDEKFVDLWTIGGVNEPVSMALTYAFYFGIPVLLLVHAREAIDRRFGTRGYLVVFLGACAVLPVFEIPMVKLLHLWTYYQESGYELGGVAWSNIWFSGMLTTSCYAGARLALRWAEVKVPVGAGAPARSPAASEIGFEDKAKAIVLGASAIWVAFYLSLSVQMLWYNATQPWVERVVP
jgi:hypothetical protein